LIATDAVMLVLRVFHIVGGVLWVGMSFFFVAFLGPAAGMVGPPVSGPLFQVLVGKMRVPNVIIGVAASTVIAGWLMWLKDLHELYDDDLGNWLFHSNLFGTVLTIGAILATIAFFEGWRGVGKNVERITELGGQIAASGGPPTSEQQSRMQQLQEHVKTHGQIDIVLLLLAVLAMSTARYWGA
jgi:hypothetical protein